MPVITISHDFVLQIGIYLQPHHGLAVYNRQSMARGMDSIFMYLKGLYVERQESEGFDGPKSTPGQRVVQASLSKARFVCNHLCHCFDLILILTIPTSSYSFPSCALPVNNTLRYTAHSSLSHLHASANISNLG
jgi:hypothetical protein